MSRAPDADRVRDPAFLCAPVRLGYDPARLCQSPGPNAIGLAHLGCIVTEEAAAGEPGTAGHIMADPYLGRRDQMFPRLTPAQIEWISAVGERRMRHPWQGPHAVEQLSRDARACRCRVPCHRQVH